MSAAFFEAYDPAQLALEAMQESARKKAEFCLATGVQPSEYDELTMIEIEEFIKAANRRNKERG